MSGPGGPPPRLLAVMVTHRRPDALAAHLEALAGQRRRPDHLVVVDNAPTMTTRELVLGADGAATRCEHLAMGENLGPAGGFARGMRHARSLGSPTDWLVLLDDDDPPDDADMLERLLDFGLDQAGSGRRVGMVGRTGARFDPRRGRLVRLRDEELTGVISVDYVAGNQFPMMPLATLDAVGVYDETLFFGLEELEYGLRVRRHAYEVLLDGGLARRARVRAGRMGGGFGGPRLTRAAAPWRRYYSIRNLVVLLRREQRLGPAVRVSAQALAKVGSMAVASPRGAAQVLRPTLRGLRDGWRGRLGRTLQPPDAGSAPDRERA